MQSPPSSPVFSPVPPAAFPQLGNPMSPSLVSPSTPSASSLIPASALCGWLYKATTEAAPLGTGDRPKLRWFIFNEDTCELEYYRNPKDLTRLGAISIHDAAFTPEAVVGSDNLYSMDVVTSKKTYRILHAQQATLDFWRQALQKRRSAMQEALLNELPINQSNMNMVGSRRAEAAKRECRIRRQHSRQQEEDEEESQSQASTGSGGVSSTSKDLAPHLEVESRVHETNRFVGPHTESQMQRSVTDVSVRNLSIEARNTFRSIAHSVLRTSSQLMSGHQTSQGSESACEAANDNSATLPPVSPKLQRNSRYSNQYRRVSTDNLRPCEECRDMRGRNQDLEDLLKAGTAQTESLKATLRLLVDSGCEQSDRSEGSQKTSEGVRKRLLELQMDCERLQNEVQIREEVIVDRDRQLMKLLNQIDELQNNPHGEDEFRRDFLSMRHERDAYLDQNKSLNAEVLNLRLLFSASVEHERDLIDAIKKLHEVYTESSLRLKQRVEELSRPQLGGTVKLSEKDRLELLADAVDEVATGEPSIPEHLQTVLLEASGELTDEYGFYIERRELDSQQMIDLTTLGPDVNISQFLEIPPVDSEMEASMTAKWERFMDENGLTGDRCDRPLKKTPELKLLLRQGSPVRLRPRIWRALVLFYVDNYRRQNGGEAIYKTLVDQQQYASFSIERKQIELDVHRSLPENRSFNVTRTAVNEDLKLGALKRVLLSFCEISESVGYCQGLDRIAATLLLNVDEEMSFWGLQVIVRRLRSENYYTSSLRDAQVDQRVFKDLIASHVPNVSQRLTQMDVDISLFSFNWFLTLFVDGFHWSIFMKIWDSFLFEGDKVLFRYAIAVVIYLEPILMKVNDVPSLYKVLRNAGRYIKDHRRLTEIAFCSLKSFPKRRITQKRAYYVQIVDKEIAKMNEERMKRRQKSSGQAMFTKESEDEDYHDSRGQSEIVGEDG